MSFCSQSDALCLRDDIAVIFFCVSTVMAVIHRKCKNVAARAAAWRRTSTDYGRGSFSFFGYISALNKLRSLYVMSSLLPTMDAASLIEASSERLSAA